MRIWPFSEIARLRRDVELFRTERNAAWNKEQELRKALTQAEERNSRLQAELTVRNAEQTILTAPVRDVLNAADDKSRTYMVGQIIQQAAARARRT